MATISLQIPVIGQPNSTEAPKIASDFTTLQTVINGQLDRNNMVSGIARLALSSVSTSVTAADGQQVQYAGSPPATITLPTPTAGATIGIVAVAPVTGAAPLTVTASSGVILDIGSSGGVASKTLGTPLANVLLMGNGSNWITVGGVWDTGWVTPTASANTVIGTLQVRVAGDRGQLRGTAHLTAGITQGTINLPAAAAPSATRGGIAVLVGVANTDLGLQASISGTVLTVQPAINSPTTASANFDFSYPL